ncbi:MAG: glycoside hydrolase family 3 C-terminal domain-containing protein, partial [Muribaculaceae bacterium]|nr:glycoside hydrolase family 3 C-terminal domain-containing protein [Muribaculaceae bacterium]
HQDAEGVDRLDFSLPYEQDKVIEALAAANPNLVVVNLTGNAYSMPWRDKVPAIVQGWYIGSEAGNAIADVLFGETNPSGKLPFTFAKSLTDYAAHASGDAEMYPGVGGDVKYKEGLKVGYRYTDELKPNRINYAFGHGLSYTDFQLGKPTVSSDNYNGEGEITVTVPVTNTGKRSGSEVVQLYVRDEKSSVYHPYKELKAFGKVNLEPGETKNVVLHLDKDAFAYYDPSDKMWTIEPGKFQLLVGNASDNISHKMQIEVVGKNLKWHD